MLEEQNWMRYAPYLFVEWKQARDEGRDVEHLRKECQEISGRKWTAALELAALSIRDVLLKAPVLGDYPYYEPSVYDEIKNALSERRHNFTGGVCSKTLEDKIAGAWAGRISGCLLGKGILLHPDQCQLRPPGICKISSGSWSNEHQNHATT